MLTNDTWFTLMETETLSVMLIIKIMVLIILAYAKLVNALKLQISTLESYD